MPNINIELSEQAYEALLVKAQAHGQTPTDWIVSKVTEPEEHSEKSAITTQPQSLAERMKGYVGTRDFEVPADLHQRTGEIFTDIVVEKHQQRRRS